MQALLAAPLAKAEELNPLLPHAIEIVLSLVVFGLLLFAVFNFL